MANKYFSQLTDLTAGSVATGDVLAIEDISAGETKGITATNLATYLTGIIGAGGWNAVVGSWTYASASTINVPAGAASIYNKGDKVRLKQGGGYKYYYIIAIADTLLTVTGGSDFTVANSAITDMYYSKVENPLSFPHWFNYTSPVDGAGGSAGAYTETQHISNFRISGSDVRAQVVKEITNKGSWSGDFRILKPFGASMVGNDFASGVIATGVLAPKAFIAHSVSAYFEFLKLAASSVLQWSDVAASDYIFINTMYQF
jgi:hypothetical protein